MTGYILRDARLIDGTGKIWDRVNIHVVGDGIHAVSPEGLQDVQAESVDLVGKTIIPGLMNCHTHICGPSIDVPPGGNTSTQLAAEYAVRGARVLEEALRRGVTAIRDVGGKEHVDLALKRMVDRGTIAGPRMRAAGNYIIMTGGHGWQQGIEVDGPHEARKAARLQLRAGADVIKVMATGGISTLGTQPGSAQLTQEEMAAAIEEAHKAGRSTAAHAEGRDGIYNAILAGVDSIEHGYELDDQIIEMMLERGTFFCPTLTCDIRFAEQGADRGIPTFWVEKMKRWIGHLLDSFQRAHNAGVRIAAGNDGFCQDWIHVGDMAGEIEAMVQYGMAPHDALIAATSNAAELLQLPDEGVIAPGRRANLVVLDKDPLADIRALSKPVTVMKDGVWVTGGTDRMPQRELA